MSDNDDSGKCQMMAFRPTPALRKRILAMRDIESRRLGIPLTSVTTQLIVAKLLADALDQLGVPRFEEELE